MGHINGVGKVGALGRDIEVGETGIEASDLIRGENRFIEITNQDEPPYQLLLATRLARKLRDQPPIEKSRELGEMSKQRPRAVLAKAVF